MKLAAARHGAVCPTGRRPNWPATWRAMAKRKRREAGGGDGGGGGGGGAEPPPKLGQLLANSDASVRERALKTLIRYLKSSSSLSRLELAKLWKALFYCVWHADKPAVHEELAERLGSLVHALPRPARWPFVEAFWATIVREWFGIDRLRLNKFYMLLRAFVSHSLTELGAAGWARADLEWHAAMLRDGPLAPSSPLGIRFALVDGFVEAANRALEGADGAGATLLALAEPFLALLGRADDDKEMHRVTDGVIEPMLGASDEDAEGAADGEARRIAALLAERLFELASDSATRERNRAHVYALQRRAEAMAGPAATPAAAKPTAKAAKRAAKAGGARKSPADPARVRTLRDLIGSGKGSAMANGAQAVNGAAGAGGVQGEAAAARRKKKRADGGARPKKKNLGRAA